MILILSLGGYNNVLRSGLLLAIVPKNLKHTSLVLGMVLFPTKNAVQH